MWRRLVFSHLKSLSSSSSSSSSAIVKPSFSSLSHRLPAATSAVRSSSFLLSRRHFSAEAVSKTKVEDVMPIATGHEREELEAELQGKDILEINHPSGPFGTKENPAIVKSVFDKRIVGCPGGEGEDEHDVVWFWLEKDKPYECPVCTQYFQLEVVGNGGDPEGHDEDEGEHHHHH
ncbi:cytochrome c oxidase subunit 5b-1, mitochondrial-like isoform X2 [Chenopodium quinoa]|uniref:cytochrome c oxidase subunit 5b-1, mitochondrial-like isoform X2 n=1 Tax=Chenopodium quinoa TaxID=63459 RepID=UPI000B778961|nr:cytochrome c oxidase subunit 5b-1, mitochondrial-like isoform X2 [Chenopodium quinoa]